MDHPSTLPTRPLDRLLGDASAGGETGVAPGFPSLLGLGAEMERLRKDRGSREQLLDALLDETAGERIFLLEHSREEDGWEVIAARSFEGEEILHPEEKVIIPLIDPCRARGEGYFTPDLEAEEVEP
ncbi:MAG: hypothetical protein ACE5GW_06015, partial [Planctomycetota bacterium]